MDLTSEPIGGPSPKPVRLNPEQYVFVTERHLATLTTLRADGSPHVTPVAFTWDQEAGVARMTTERDSVKARNARLQDRRGGLPRAALCQVDGGRWLTLEGIVTVCEEPDAIADAERRHARRYSPLDADPERILLVLAVDRVMASTYMA